MIRYADNTCPKTLGRSDKFINFDNMAVDLIFGPNGEVMRPTQPIGILTSQSTYWRECPDFILHVAMLVGFVQARLVDSN